MVGFEGWAWLSVASLGAWLAAFDKISEERSIT